MEADRIGNKWIDTDHLLLGILCEPDCLAAQELVKAGIPLEKARHIVIENRLQRLKRLSRLKLGSLALPGWILSWLRSKRRGRKSESSEKTPGAAGADNSKLS
jgi:Clp amino terminal domain, pathogenicity island component